MARSFLRARAIASMHEPTEAMADSLYSAVFGSDIERATDSRQDSASKDALPGPTGHDGSDHVSSLKSLDVPGAFGFRARKARRIDSACLPVAMPIGCDQQGNQASHCDVLWCASSHAGSIKPVGFLQPSADSMEHRQAPRTDPFHLFHSEVLEHQAGRALVGRFFNAP